MERNEFIKKADNILKRDKIAIICFNELSDVIFDSYEIAESIRLKYNGTFIADIEDKLIKEVL
jgi:hypothetical protein